MAINNHEGVHLKVNGRIDASILPDASGFRFDDTISGSGIVITVESMQTIIEEYNKYRNILKSNSVLSPQFETIKSKVLEHYK